MSHLVPAEPSDDCILRGDPEAEPCRQTDCKSLTPGNCEIVKPVFIVVSSHSSFEVIGYAAVDNGNSQEAHLGRKMMAIWEDFLEEVITVCLEG